MSVVVTETCATAVWLRAAGKCRLVSCLAIRPAVDGFNVDASAACTILDCRSVDAGNNGAVFDCPRTVLSKCRGKALADAVEELAATAHIAQARAYAQRDVAARLTRAHACRLSACPQRLTCTGSGCNGVLVDGGVAVDLSNSVLRDNALNGLRITDAVLPGATARITLTGSDISNNGADEHADAAQGEQVGIALEKNKAGVSRLGVVQPPGAPWVGVRLSNNCGGDSMEVTVK